MMERGLVVQLPTVLRRERDRRSNVQIGFGGKISKVPGKISNSPCDPRNYFKRLIYGYLGLK